MKHPIDPEQWEKALEKRSSQENVGDDLGSLHPIRMWHAAWRGEHKEHPFNQG